MSCESFWRDRRMEEYWMMRAGDGKVEWERWRVWFYIHPREYV